MNLAQIIRKQKKKRFVSISAGGSKSGIQGVCFDIDGNGSWEIASQTIVPYTEQIETMISCLNESEKPAVTVEELAGLDMRITRLFIDCAQSLLKQTPDKHAHPSCALLNPFTLWKGHPASGGSPDPWVFTLGDPVHFTAVLNTPVLTDFMQYSYRTGHNGNLPLQRGLLRMTNTQRSNETHVFINIGIISHLLAIDTCDCTTVLESDTGPGTCLINLLSSECGCPDGFDRDGILTAEGTVDKTALSTMLKNDWFLQPSPKSASPHAFSSLAYSPSLTGLSSQDKMATITALIARSVFDFYKKEYRHKAPPTAVWISGGGAHNGTLMEFIKNYFDPIPVRNMDVLGIEPEMCTPLALGLTAYDLINNGKYETQGKIDGFCTVIWP